MRFIDAWHSRERSVTCGKSTHAHHFDVQQFTQPVNPVGNVTHADRTTVGTWDADEQDELSVNEHLCHQGRVCDASRPGSSVALPHEAVHHLEPDRLERGHGMEHNRHACDVEDGRLDPWPPAKELVR